MVRVVSPKALSGPILMSLSAAGWAAPEAASVKAEARMLLINPPTIVETGDMDFATLGVTTGGTATIDPISGNMTVTFAVGASITVLAGAVDGIYSGDFDATAD